MTNIVIDLISKGADVAATNPWVAGGMFVGGILITVFEWRRRKRKERKK